MKKSLISTCIVALFALMACEETDVSSYMPTWKGFAAYPTQIHAGDSVCIVAQQAEKGHLIGKTSYTWTVKGSYYYANRGLVDSTFTIVNSVVYDSNPQDPSVTFKLAENFSAQYLQVSFVANYNYTGQGVVGTDGHLCSDSYGSLHQSSSTSIFGKSVGEFKVKVY